MTPTRQADPDAAYRAYFHAARPDPWPWPDAAPARLAEPRRAAWSASRSRLTLAASVLVVLAGGLALVPRATPPSKATAPAGPGRMQDGSADGKDKVDVLVPPLKRRP